MGRAISIELQQHFDQKYQTTAHLLRIDPVRPGYSSYGVTDIDRDITYDDGTSELTYSAAIGFESTEFSFNPTLSADNADMTSLLPVFDIPVSEDVLRSGAYDFAEFTLYKVNYEDLTQGHVIVGSGNLGRVSLKDGLSFVSEMNGMSKQLAQSVCPRYSRTCRATFGSQPPGTGGGVKEEEDYCGFDAESLFESFEVTNVGTEPTVEFTDALLPFPDSPTEDIYHRGLIRWVTGLNAGREYEVEGNTTGGTVTTMFAMDYPAQVGDTGLIRRGCNKQARDTERGCAHWFGSQWTIHVRAEPDLPLGDALANSVPGGNAGPGEFGGSTNVEETSEL